MKTPLPSARFSLTDFKQHVLARLQQLAARQEARPYAPLLTELRKNAIDLQPAK